MPDAVVASSLKLQPPPESGRRPVLTGCPLNPMKPADPHPHALGYERAPQYLPVARFSDSAEAAMAATHLQSESLDFEVVEHTKLHGLGVHGATLLVADEDFARAVEVLSRTPAKRCLLVLPAMEPAVVPPRRETTLLRWLRRIRSVR